MSQTVGFLKSMVQLVCTPGVESVGRRVGGGGDGHGAGTGHGVLALRRPAMPLTVQMTAFGSLRSFDSVYEPLLKHPIWLDADGRRDQRLGRQALARVRPSA